jgi:hypothetical protein
LFHKWQKEKKVTSIVHDEWELYLNVLVIDVGEDFDPRAWWLEPT